MHNEFKLLPETGYENGFPKLKRTEVTFLLATDYYVGSPVIHEQRVAITPQQARALKDWLASLGINLNLFVVNGAGERADFSDREYASVGATMLDLEGIASMEPPHLVQTLKGPCAYETTIPGNFMRIGGLDADFGASSGLADLLLSSEFSALFDSSAVGGFAYTYNSDVKPRLQMPMRSSRSVYAGRLAGEDVGVSLGVNERVVVSGGGVVGTSAVDVLLEKHAHQLREILIIEKVPERCELLREMYAGHAQVCVKHGFDIQDEDLRGCQGLILTIFVLGNGITPKVTSIDQVVLMQDGAHIVDVAIDKGGGIASRFDNETDPATGKRRIASIEEIRTEVAKLNRTLNYFADTHMPRRRPREASIEHGKAALMYLACMLYFCAAKGGALQAAHYFMNHDYIVSPKTLADGLILDLKHGLAIANQHHTMALYCNILKYSDEIQSFLNDQGIHNVLV